MASWKPNATVGKNESIGRRLFQRQGLKGAEDQKRPDRTIELYHFEENKDREVSVDRLGATSIDGKVKAYLNPRGHYEATRLHRANFRGWAVTKAKELQTPAKGKPLKIAASPIAAQNGDELSENRYHAHIDMLQEYDSHDMAVRLKYIFERNYHLEPCIPPDREGLFRWAARWFRTLWHRTTPTLGSTEPRR
jgi:hypothetical protein